MKDAAPPRTTRLIGRLWRFPAAPGPLAAGVGVVIIGPPDFFVVRTNGGPPRAVPAR